MAKVNKKGNKCFRGNRGFTAFIAFTASKAFITIFNDCLLAIEKN
jgi:hypothetical protein